MNKLKMRDESPISITDEGLRRLKEKLKRLKGALPEYIAETQRTAAYGDRSENDEYRDAKSTLRRAHRQILSTQDQIKRAVVINPNPKNVGKAQLGSIVALEASGGRREFQILGSHEANPSKGRISNQSPLGAALMNHVKGDTITIKTTRGVQTYRILEIR